MSISPATLLAFSTLRKFRPRGRIGKVGGEVGGIVITGRITDQKLGRLNGSWVGRTVGRLVGLFVGRMVGRFVGRFLGRFVGRMVGRFVGILVVRFVGRLVGLLVGRLLEGLVVVIFFCEYNGGRTVVGFLDRGSPVGNGLGEMMFDENGVRLSSPIIVVGGDVVIILMGGKGMGVDVVTVSISIKGVSNVVTPNFIVTSCVI